MKIHRLKLKDEYFDEAVKGNKPWEIRLNDRNYEVNDLIEFIRVDGNGVEYLFPFNSIQRETYYAQIIYILKDSPMLADGYVCFTIKRVHEDFFRLSKRFLNMVVPKE